MLEGKRNKPTHTHTHTHAHTHTRARTRARARALPHQQLLAFSSSYDESLVEVLRADLLLVGMLRFMSWT